MRGGGEGGSVWVVCVLWNQSKPMLKVELK